MADSFVRVPTDSTGKRVDATSLDVGADTVYRQRIVIGDNSATDQFAVVTGGALVCTGTFNISSMPAVNVNGGVAISGTAIVAGNINISATAVVSGVVALTAGTANIGSLNHISRTVTVVGNVTLLAGTANFGTLNDISRTVQVAVGTPFIIQGISTTVLVAMSNQTLQGISTTVTVAGNVNISATATAIIGAVLDATDATPVRVGDSANTAIRVNVVAGSSGGVSQVDGTTFSTQAANFVPIGGIFDDAATNTLSENDAGVVRLTTNRGMHVNLRTDGGTAMDDSANSALRVNVVAGGTSGVLPPPTLTSGIFTAAAQTAAFSLSAMAGVSVQLTGTWTGQIEFEVTTNNTDWVSHSVINIATDGQTNATTGNGVFFGNVASFRQFRIRASTLTAGTASYAINANFAHEHQTVKVVGTATIVGVVSLAAGSILDSISATVGVKGQVSLAAGTSNIGFINNISATVAVTGTVALAAGTANIGTLQAISTTVQVAVGTPFTIQGISTTVLVAMSNQTIQGISTTVTVAGVVGLTAGAANIGFINNISATVVAVLNTSAAIPSVSRGPLCVTASTSAGVALISAPGAGNFVYITMIACTNGSGTLTRADVFAASQTATCIAQMYMAASGGGFVIKYDPPVRVQSNTQVTCRVDPDVSQAIFNVHFYVQNT